MCLSINTQRETTDSEPYFIILACIQISGKVLFAEVNIDQILNNFKENIEELKWFKLNNNTNGWVYVDQVQDVFMDYLTKTMKFLI